MRNDACLLLVLLPFAACANQRVASRECEGTLILNGISRPETRRDARTLILQFAGLDREVEADVARSTTDRVIIKSWGDGCDRFARSFLASDMPEFQGLRYEPLN